METNTNEKDMKELDQEELEETAAGVERCSGLANTKADPIEAVKKWIKGLFD